MTARTRVLRRCAVGVAVLAALTSGPTGCSDTSTNPAPPPSSSTPAPLPTQDWNRAACTTLPHDWLDLLDQLADTRTAAESATKSTDPGMRLHGQTLLTAVTAREVADLAGDHNAAVAANLDISQAAIDLGAACSRLYGDGNW